MMSIILNAHQADVSSTMLIERSPGDWVVQIRSALTAFEHEVKVQYGDDAFATPAEFKGLVIGHVEQNLLLQINDQRIDLSNGFVKLGHETSVVFELTDVPKNITTIKVINTSFMDIPRNKSALMVYKKDVSKEQFILDSKNQHSVKLEFDNSKFTLLTEGSIMHSGYFNFASICSVLLTLVIVGLGTLLKYKIF